RGRVVDETAVAYGDMLGVAGVQVNGAAIGGRVSGKAAATDRHLRILEAGAQSRIVDGSAVGGSVARERAVVDAHGGVSGANVGAARIRSDGATKSGVRGGAIGGVVGESAIVYCQVAACISDSATAVNSGVA